MCIRDRSLIVTLGAVAEAERYPFRTWGGFTVWFGPGSGTCLLYTSDAADERSSVDLGGRRIIKKNKQDGVRGERV